MKFVILNTHSVLNSGDAGIVLAQVQFLKNQFPGADISLTSRTPNIDKKLCDLDGIKIFPCLIPAPSVYAGGWKKIEKSLMNIVDISSKWQMYQELKSCDLALCSGGGYFYSNRPVFPGPMFLQNVFHAKLALAMNKPLVFLPQSFGPIYSRFAAKLLKNLLEEDSAVKIYTRENISFDFLHQLLGREEAKAKVETCPDMAFLTKSKFCEEPLPELCLPRPVMGLTLRHWEFPEVRSEREKREKENRYLGTLMGVCREFVARWKGSIVIYPQVRGPGTKENDCLISRRFFGDLMESIPEKHIKLLELADVLSPVEIFRIISQLDLILSTRFHSALFALISGVPAIAIAYQPKSRGIMKMMNLEHFCVDMAELDLLSLIGLISEILDHSAEIKKNAAKEVESARTALERKLKEALLSLGCS